MALFGTSVFGGSSPVSAGNINAVGTGVSDIFAGLGTEFQIEGMEKEKTNYYAAAGFARQEAQYTEMSTAIQEAQADRQLYLSLGKTKSEVAGAGFAESGSALDILRSSASQGALQHAVIGQQGLITEQGYQEQAQAYENMASAIGSAEKGANLAMIGDYVGAGISAVAAFV